MAGGLALAGTVTSAPTDLPTFLKLQEDVKVYLFTFLVLITYLLNYTSLSIQQNNQSTNQSTMYTSIKTLAAAIVLPLVAALPLNQRAETAFNTSQPFTLHTEVVKGNSTFGGKFLTSFHVGAGQSTVVATSNSSYASAFSEFDKSLISIKIMPLTHPPVLSDSVLKQPVSIGGVSDPNFGFNITLVEQAPFRSNAPANYDYIDLSASGKSTTGFHFNGATLAWSNANSTTPSNFDGCFALCYVNGTSPYFSLGPQYQLLWKASSATSSYAHCADVALVATKLSNI